MGFSALNPAYNFEEITGMRLLRPALLVKLIPRGRDEEVVQSLSAESTARDVRCREIDLLNRFAIWCVANYPGTSPLSTPQKTFRVNA